MPISPGALALIRNAGEALRKAYLVIDTELAEQSSTLVKTLTGAPFSSDADNALSDIRSVSVIRLEIATLEQKLITIFQSAEKVTGQEAPVEVLKAIGHTPRTARASKEQPVDVQARPVATKSKPGRKPRVVKEAKPLSPSAQKVHDALLSILKKKAMTAVQQASLAAEIGISTASVNTAFKALLEQGLITTDGKGFYALP